MSPKKHAAKGKAPLYINLYSARPSFLLHYARYLVLQEALRRHRRELLLFCQHPPTITAGVQSHQKNLLVPAESLHAKGIVCIQTRRGGDYSAHEPGQCLIYPHIDLARRSLGIHSFIHALLGTTAELLQKLWGIGVFQRERSPGLYRQSDGAKIASIGLMFRSFFTSFGLALNISNNLETFSYIHPCGHANEKMCSVQSCAKNTGPEELRFFIESWRKNFSERLSLE